MSESHSRPPHLPLIAVLLVAILGTAASTVSGAPRPSDGAGRLAFAAYRHGNWDIYSVDASGGDLRRMTTHPGQDRAPAWSPDGRRLAFQSRRDDNWDIYVVDARGGPPVRLTTDPHYDGAPSWSPDGQRIAFESYRAGDLDVFVMNADGSGQINLTAGERQGDCDPAWSPDGQRLAFTSWRFGDKDVFVMDADGGNVRQLTDTPQPQGSPVWSPDGQRLAIVVRDYGSREVYEIEVDAPPASGGAARRLTWFTSDDSPAWSPDGQRLAFISRSKNDAEEERLLVLDPEAVGQLPRVVVEGWVIDGPLAWSASAPAWGEPVVDVENDVAPASGASPLADETPPYGFVYLDGVEAPNSKFHPGLIPAFQALRARIERETGRDFMAELSDIWRGLDAYVGTSAYISWHKAGRAFDLRFDLRSEEGMPLLHVVREDIGGRVYWRMFLKCVEQDGSQGVPLKVQPWNLTGRARRRNPQHGGDWNYIPYGYFVDITALAREYGWERIPAVDQPDFSWKWHFKALEYWHYQQSDDLTWYQAMLEVYPPGKLAALYNWPELVSQDEDEYLLFLDGIPRPPSAERWRAVRP